MYILKSVLHKPTLMPFRSTDAHALAQIADSVRTDRKRCTAQSSRQSLDELGVNLLASDVVEECDDDLLLRRRRRRRAIRVFNRALSSSSIATIENQSF